MLLRLCCSFASGGELNGSVYGKVSESVILMACDIVRSGRLEFAQLHQS